MTLQVATGPTPNADDVDCALTPGQVNTGLRNTVTVTADGVQHVAATCTPVEPAPTSIEVLPGSTDRPGPGVVLPATGAGAGVGGLRRTGLGLLLAGAAVWIGARRRPASMF